MSAGLLEIGAAFLGVAALATAGLIAALWPALRRGIRRPSPALRARLAWLLAAGPVLLPALLLALAVLPSLLAAVGLAGDHCRAHPEHLHLCWRHGPAWIPGPLAWTAAAAAAAIGAAVGDALLGGLRSRRLARRLDLASSEALAPGVRLVDSPRPFSVVAGSGQGRIFVSRGLAEVLSAPQLAAVVAHERAHAERRDGLWSRLAGALSRFHLPAVRRGILREYGLACELACDARAAEAVRDGLLVAEALLAAERALAAAPDWSRTAPAPSIAGAPMTERVDSLLRDDERRRRAGADPGRPGAARWLRRAALGSLALVALGLLADPLHHGLEHALGRLLS